MSAETTLPRAEPLRVIAPLKWPKRCNSRAAGCPGAGGRAHGLALRHRPCRRGQKVRSLHLPVNLVKNAAGIHRIARYLGHAGLDGHARQRPGPRLELMRLRAGPRSGSGLRSLCQRVIRLTWLAPSMLERLVLRRELTVLSIFDLCGVAELPWAEQPERVL